MAAGSLTLGGNLSIAVGPLGRNAEGSGAVNSKGKVAAMYSYSKTKGLFGGVSVEGSVILERQDANRIAYGGSPSVKQILSGAIEPPEWAYVLIDTIERCTASRTAKWISYEEEEEGAYGSPQGGRSRSGSGGDYAFGGGVGGSGSTPAASSGGGGGGRRRAGSLFGSSGKEERAQPDTDRASPRPTMNKRSSSFNPFSSGSSTPKRNPILSSSESYNAGLTFDSDGPMQSTTRSRSGSVARRNLAGDDLLGDWGEPKPGEPIWKGKNGDNDLLGTWNSDTNGLSASFNKLSTGSNGNTTPGRRSRSGTTTSRPFEDIAEDDYVPFETESRFAKMSPADRAAVLSDKSKRQSMFAAVPTKSPFGEDNHERQPFDDYHRDPSPPRTRELKPSLSVRDGLDGDDGYARAMALFPFEATTPGDLGLKKGDVVVVLDTVGNGDWWRGRATSGREGIFPSNYVEVVRLPKSLKGGVTRTALKTRMADLGFD